MALSYGARLHNIIGTYLHGSLLPKNPKIADFLIEKALERRGIKPELSPLGLIDEMAQLAQRSAMQRVR